jgi:hypothetical protein
MKKKPEKVLTLDLETLREISGGFPTTLGPLSATLRTATIATRTLPQGPNGETKLEA